MRSAPAAFPQGGVPAPLTDLSGCSFVTAGLCRLIAMVRAQQPSDDVQTRSRGADEPGLRPKTPPRMTTQTLALLSVMLSAPDAEWYGLQLAQAADLKSGTVYPALARLEQAEWLISSWEDVDPSGAGRPRRRLYRLSGVGADAARSVLDEHLKRLTASQHRAGGWRLRPGRSVS